MADTANDTQSSPRNDQPIPMSDTETVEAEAPGGGTDTTIGRQAIRIFRAARRRRLALPPDQRPRLSPGLVALLTARGWHIPAELLPEQREHRDNADPSPPSTA